MPFYSFTFGMAAHFPKTIIKIGHVEIESQGELSTANAGRQRGTSLPFPEASQLLQIGSNRNGVLPRIDDPRSTTGLTKNYSLVRSCNCKALGSVRFSLHFRFQWKSYNYRLDSSLQVPCGFTYQV